MDLMSLPKRDQDLPLSSRAPLRWVFGWGFRVISRLRKCNQCPPLDLGRERRVFVNTELLSDQWTLEVNLRGGPPSLLRALIRCYKWRYLAAGVWKLLWTVSTWTGAYYILKVYLKWILTETPQSDGYIWSSALLVSGLVSAVAMNQLNIECSSISVQVRAALTGLVYFKLLIIARSCAGAGVANLVSVDIPQVSEACMELHYLWSGVVETVLAIFLVFWEVGYSALAAVAVIAVLLPIQLYAGIRIGKLQKDLSAVSAERVHCVSELLTAIKLVKFYAWEPMFRTHVKEFREEESVLRKRIFLWKALSYTLVFSVPVFCALFTLTLHTIRVRDVSATVVFVVLSLLNTLRYPFLNIPPALCALTGALVALGRITKYLLEPEISLPELRDPPEECPKLVFSLTNATFTWEGFEPSLLDINLSLERGRLLAVMGDVGAGKSTLVSSLAGQTTLVRGSLDAFSRVAYVPQEAWIMGSQTLRANILFGNTYYHGRYSKVIRACGLEHDIANMAAGDLTEMAERGANLSGGQRQRVALARAAYSDARLVLLDDPLAALDQAVGARIFQECIQDFLINTEERAVVFVTQQLQQIRSAHEIIIMEKGVIAKRGAFAELCKDPEFGDMISKHALDVPIDASDSSDEIQIDEECGGAPRPRGECNDLTEGDVHVQIEDRRHTRALSLYEHPGEAQHRMAQLGLGELNSLSLYSRNQLTALSGGNHAAQISVGRLRRLYEETSATALTRIDSGLHGIATEIRRNEVTVASSAENTETSRDEHDSPSTIDHQKSGFCYFRAGSGILVTIFVLIVFFFVHALRLMSDYWLKLWSTNELNKPRNFYFWIYGILALAFALGCFLRVLLLSKDTCAKSRSLHDSAFSRIIGAKQAFFDTTPIGRTLSVFSRHQQVVDMLLPDTLLRALQYVPLSVGTILIPIAFVPFVFGPLIVCVFMTIGAYVWISPSDSLLRRADAAARAPLASHIITTAEGIASVRAYSLQHGFTKANFTNVDRSSGVVYASSIVRCTFSLVADTITSLAVYFTALFLQLFRSRLDNPESTAGLALSNALQLSVFLQWTARMCADAVNMLPSAAQLSHLASQEVPREDQREIPPPDNWPSSGEIKFENVCLRYRPNGIDVLKEVSFFANAGEKIGLVGRTGSGKSTLLIALMRIVEIYSGSIKIDGVDISGISLKDLRRAIAIIPQEPVLFSGTVRSNLDPFSTRTDEEIYEVLRKVRLMETISRYPKGLEADITDSGSAYSLGQRQLFCIARAILLRTKILVLDEASSALDAETDSMIQEVLRSCFRDITILTVAHRLHTIIDSNKVLLMDSGAVREFDEPVTLLNNIGSQFYKLVSRAGEAATQELLRAAQAASESRRAASGRQVLNIKEEAGDNPDNSPVTSFDQKDTDHKP